MQGRFLDPALGRMSKKCISRISVQSLTAVLSSGPARDRARRDLLPAMALMKKLLWRLVTAIGTRRVTRMVRMP